MRIKVLQGVNLKNDETTIVAQMKSVKPDLLNFFKELHPIFMSDYEIKENSELYVHTQLPSLWKNEEFLQPIEDHAEGTKELEDAQNAMLDIIKLQLSSMSTIPILHAAHELGYETLQLFVNKGFVDKTGMNRDYTIGIGKEQQGVHSAASTKDSTLALKTQRNKMYTNQFIEAMGMPIAKWASVNSRENVAEVCNRVGYPLVMKPVGLTGGHGVMIGMENEKEALEAWDRIQEYYNKDMKYKDAKAGWQMNIIVQRVLKGKDYRILVIGGKVEAATHRLQARVVGDGKLSVEELIEEENKNPDRNMRLPTHTLKPIVIDKDLKKVLKKQDLSLDYVPEKNEEVRVRDVASMSQGGITADVTDKLNPQTKHICESIAQSVHANVLGVDVLAQDISKPLTLDNGGIIEMNTMPEIYLNAYPVIGTGRPEIGEKIVRSLMNPTIHTYTVVVIGDISGDEINENITKVIANPGNIGRYNNGTIYIDGYAINSELDTNTGVLALKKNASLDTIALHYDSIEEVENHGFGFNEIDLMIISEAQVSKIKDRLEKLRKKELLHEMVIF